MTICGAKVGPISSSALREMIPLMAAVRMINSWEEQEKTISMVKKVSIP